jgi:hypothetical protein
MKLRLDLLKHLTADDILEEAAANQHRYQAEPNFSKTGVGSLRPATVEERTQEEARSEALIRKLKKRLKESEKRRLTCLKARHLQGLERND